MGLALPAAVVIGALATPAIAQPIFIPVPVMGSLTCGPGSPSTLLQQPILANEFADISLALQVQAGYTARLEVSPAPLGGTVMLVGAGTTIITPPGDLTESFPGPFNDTLRGSLDGPFLLTITCTPPAQPPPPPPEPGPPPPPPPGGANPDMLTDLVNQLEEAGILKEVPSETCTRLRRLATRLLEELTDIDNQLRARSVESGRLEAGAALARLLVPVAVEDPVVERLEAREAQLIAALRALADHPCLAEMRGRIVLALGNIDAPLDGSSLSNFAPDAGPPISLDAITALSYMADGGLPEDALRRRNKDLWVRGTGTLLSSQAGPGRSAGIGAIAIGMEKAVLPDLTIGLFAQGRGAQAQLPALGQTLNLTGVGLGVYANKAFAERFQFSALAFYEYAWNTFVAPTATANFNSQRIGLAAKLSGEWTAGQWAFIPAVGVRYQPVFRGAFVDSAGVAVAANTFQRGDLTLGGTISYDWINTGRGPLITLTPSLRADLVWGFLTPGTFNNAGLVVVNNPGITGELAAGLEAAFVGGVSTSLSVSVTGLGGNVLGLSTAAELRLPLYAIGLGRPGGATMGLGFAAQPLDGSLTGTARLRVPLQ